MYGGTEEAIVYNLSASTKHMMRTLGKSCLAEYGRIRLVTQSTITSYVIRLRSNAAPSPNYAVVCARLDPFGSERMVVRGQDPLDALVDHIALNECLIS